MSRFISLVLFVSMTTACFEPIPAPPLEEWSECDATSNEVEASDEIGWADVAPIFHERCSDCHAPDGSAPFVFDSYEEVHALRHVGHRARHGLPRRDAGHRPDAGGVAQGPVAGLRGRRRGRARRVGALEAIDASLDGVALVRGRPDGVAEGRKSGREEAFEGIGRGIRPGAFDGEVGAR